MPIPPNIITLHQREDGALILERGYDTKSVRYRLIEEIEDEERPSKSLYRDDVRPVEAETDENDLDHLEDRERR